MKAIPHPLGTTSNRPSWKHLSREWTRVYCPTCWHYFGGCDHAIWI